MQSGRSRATISLQFSAAFVRLGPGEQIGSGVLVVVHFGGDGGDDVVGAGAPDPVLSAAAGEPDQFHLAIVSPKTHLCNA